MATARAKRGRTSTASASRKHLRRIQSASTSDFAYPKSKSASRKKRHSESDVRRRLTRSSSFDDEVLVAELRAHTPRPVSCRNLRQANWILEEIDEDLRRSPIPGAASPSTDSFDVGKPVEKQSSEPKNESVFWDFMLGELRLRGHEVTLDYDVQSQRVLNFVRLIYVIERLIFFGISVCLDQFLLVFTFLPLRAGIATFSSIKRRHMRTEYLRDLCNLVLLTACFLGLGFLHIGKLYHAVRAQSFMKLYVLYNMLALFARLFYSLGEDLLDSLYGCCSNPHTTKLRFFLTLLATTAYMLMHSAFMCLQIVTLNVSINSNDKTLLIILISSQFVELKSSCFKKFGHKNLFQLACSDVVERFEMFVFMIILIIQNTSAIGMGTEASLEWLRRAFYVGFLLIVSEFGVDWLKHGFITKFNMIDPGIYEVYRLILCGDVTKEARPSSAIPSLRTTLRRFGFIPIPLAGVLFRVVWDAMASLSPGVKLAVCLMTWINLIALKLLVRIYTLGHAAKYVFVDSEVETMNPKKYKIRTPTKVAKNTPAETLDFEKVGHTPLRVVAATPKLQNPLKGVENKAMESEQGKEVKKPKQDSSVGRISGDVAEQYTSMFPETYKPLETAEKLAGVSRYTLLESRVP